MTSKKIYRKLRLSLKIRSFKVQLDEERDVLKVAPEVEARF